MIDKNELIDALVAMINDDSSDIDVVMLSALRRLWRSRRKEVNDAFKRTLPLGDYIVDRWEKASSLGFGKGSSIYDSALVFGDVTVKDDTWIGPFVILDGTGGIRIGSNCSISSGVQVYTHDTVEWALSGNRNSYDYSTVIIGDNCYIGPNSVITKGVTIGNKCIIGANSLVLDDIPDNSKAYGTPCKVVQELE